ncbi:MAG: hypothetical protein RL519_954, partial [Pseudomonadota bacterium]
RPGPGFCHIPSDRGVEWYHQLTAEKLMTRYVKGFPVREWHQTRPRNEALDCRVYALAALKIVNPSFKRAAERLLQIDRQPMPVREKEIAPEESLDSATDTVHVKRPKKVARKRGGWVKNW